MKAESGGLPGSEQVITGHDICFVIGLFAYHMYSSQASAAHLPHPVISYGSDSRANV
jgi:hypothetical protein